MKRFSALACVAALAACGGGSTGMNGAEASAYRSAALQVSGSVTSYDTATTNMTTPADCTAAVQQHETQVSPVLQRMGQMAGGMDDAMRSMAQTMSADMQCGVAVMQQEMQQHLGAACESSDMATNRAEAQRHVDAMRNMTAHMEMRADQMSALMIGGGMMQGAMTEGGTMNGGTARPGTGGASTMPDGTVMSWDTPMPGCELVNGSFREASAAAPAGGAPTASM